MKFHMALFSATVYLALFPGKVNPGHTGLQCPISPNLFKITIVTIDDGQEVIYMRFHLAPLSLT